MALALVAVSAAVARLNVGPFGLVFGDGPGVERLPVLGFPSGSGLNQRMPMTIRFSLLPKMNEREKTI